MLGSISEQTRIASNTTFVSFVVCMSSEDARCRVNEFDQLSRQLLEQEVISHYKCLVIFLLYSSIIFTIKHDTFECDKKHIKRKVTNFRSL